MKSLILGIALLLLSFTVFAESFSFRCLNIEKQRFDFHVSLETNTISFNNIDYFGDAQILKDTDFGVQVEESGKSIIFSYDWYYTAEYQLHFINRAMFKYAIGEEAQVLLSFDDSDNARAFNEKFLCLRHN